MKTASPEIRTEGRRDVPLTVIEPRHGWRGAVDWREMWAYRELLFVLAARDIKVRYKQSVLGAAWAVLRPLTAMGIFTVVFGHLAHMPSDGVPYPLFVFTGLLPWLFFSTTVGACAHSLVGSAHLISKVYFPRLLIPMSSIGAAVVDLAVSACVLLAMLVAYGVPLHPQLLAAPFAIAGLGIAAIGFGTLLAAVTVSYRDFQHITPFLLQVWMYATPIVFPTSLAPKEWRWVFYLNPVSGFTDAFRSAFLGLPLDIGALALSLAMACVALGLGITYFQSAERRFADVI